jgi:hypothetical protein
MSWGGARRELLSGSHTLAGRRLQLLTALRYEQRTWQRLEVAAESRSAERDTPMVLLGLTMGMRLAEMSSVKPAATVLR